VENAEENVANAIRDSYFSTVAPSVVAAACVAKAFRDSNIQFPSIGIEPIKGIDECSVAP
jgi:hypothetical protein